MKCQIPHFNLRPTKYKVGIQYYIYIIYLFIITVLMFMESVRERDT